MTNVGSKRPSHRRPGSVALMTPILDALRLIKWVVL
jgi:hypothetical protein